MVMENYIIKISAKRFIFLKVYRLGFGDFFFSKKKGSGLQLCILAFQSYDFSVSVAIFEKIFLTLLHNENTTRGER